MTVETGARVPHSFWSFSLHSEVRPLVDSFIRWDVIIGVASILQVPKQLTLATRKLWSWLRILCLTASSAWHPETFGNRTESLRSQLDWVRWLLPAFSQEFYFYKIFFFEAFFKGFFFYIRWLAVRNSIKKKPSSQHENFVQQWNCFHQSRANTLINIIHHLYKG